MKIGILEDSETFANALRDILVLKKHVVHLLYKHPLMISKTDIENLDVLILDIYLGSNYGINIINQLKKMDLFLTIVIVTASPNQNLKDILKGLGVHYLIEKPFHYEELDGILKEIEEFYFIIENFLKAEDHEKNILLLTDTPNVKILKRLKRLKIEEFLDFDFENDQDNNYYLEFSLLNNSDHIYKIIDKLKFIQKRKKIVLHLKNSIEELKSECDKNRILKNFIHEKCYLVSNSLKVS
ncbi:MAG: response regulator [candidate division WOR-3 bacterium]|jgi:response regulator RpfG family c-di-GMP phosphodiesterase